MHSSHYPSRRNRPLEPITNPALLQATATGSQLIALLLVQQRLRHRSLTWWTLVTALCLLSSIVLVVGNAGDGGVVPLALVSLGIGYGIRCGARQQANLATRPLSPQLLRDAVALSFGYGLLYLVHPIFAAGVTLGLVDLWLWQAGLLLLKDRSPGRLGAHLAGSAILAQAALLPTYPLASQYSAYMAFGIMAISLATQLQGWGVLMMVLTDTERRLQDLNDELHIQIHERTQALIRAERMAMLGQIAAKVAHEIKNKLNVINAALYFLSQDHVNAERRERTRQRVEQTIASTAHLVSDLLQLAKPQQSEPGPVDLADVLEPILHAVVPATVSVQRHIPEDTPSVLADRQQVEQVLLNVVINAVEAMPHGGSLVISLEHQGERVCMTVVDSGDGVANADLPKVFETFWTTKPQGTGLGLSISRNLIEQQGGCIQLTKGDDHGTRVVIELPTAVPEAVAPAVAQPVNP